MSDVLHQAARIGKRRKAKACMQAMGVARGKQDFSHIQQFWVCQNRPEQHLRKAHAPMAFQYKYFRKVAKGGLVGYDPGKSHLPDALDDTKT